MKFFTKEMPRIGILVLFSIVYLPTAFAIDLYVEGKSLSYKNGKALLAENLEIVQRENGFFVAVPVDYSDPSKGTTEIYAHFKRPYNPSLPTFVLFTGGPGQSSHFFGGKSDYYANLDFNFLLFDQRGIAFSRPINEALWKDPAFHSSVNNARDLEEIRKFLKIEKISVYGASYGTVPATIYGNLFHSSTRSVVLEGVVFDGFDATPQRDNFILNLVSRYFFSLPTALQDKLSRISDDIILPKMWFPTYVSAFLTFSGTAQLTDLTELLIGAAKVDDKDFLVEFTRLQSILNSGASSSKSLDEDLVNFMLMAKEFGFTNREVITQMILEEGQIKKQKLGNLSGYVVEARNLGLPLDVASTYRASDYPVYAPIYYLNGARDGATIPPWVIKHWKTVPKNNAYLFLLQQGGHMPGGQILQFDSDLSGKAQDQAQYFFNLFKRMLNGDPINQMDILDFNKKGHSKLAFTSRASSRDRLSCRDLIQK